MVKSILLFPILLAFATLSYGAMPSLSVTVSDAAGHVAFKGRTNSGGAFATPKLQPGDYVVQFNSNSPPQGQYALVIASGKQKVSSEGVDGSKFAQGGIAMRIKVGKDLYVSGQVSNGAAMERSNPKVKMVKGKRWFWVTSTTGSNVGGHWVEEGSAEARNLSTYSRDAIRNIQEKAKGAPNE